MRFDPDMIRIESPVNGEALNRAFVEWRNGVPMARVTGSALPDRVVTVNGWKASREGKAFTVDVPIRRTPWRIVAVVDTPRGAKSDAVVICWDDADELRYRFSVDDNILFLKDIAKNAVAYRSIFDCSYLAFRREMHRRFGVRVHFNIYWETDDFDLTMMPDKYRGEWQDNADWIRLTFHARADLPPKPYAEKTYEIIRSDYLAVTEQIARFAGPELLDDFTTIHWGGANLECCQALRDSGMRGLVGYFQRLDGEPHVAYYLDGPRLDHLGARDYWKDMDEDIFFVRTDMVVNMMAREEIRPKLDEIASDPKQARVMELMIHEQYFWECTGLLQPDAKQKVETALTWVTERNYTSVFFGEVF